MRDRIIKYDIEVKFVKDKYTTSVIVKFDLSQRSRDKTLMLLISITPSSLL